MTEPRPRMRSPDANAPAQSRSLPGQAGQENQEDVSPCTGSDAATRSVTNPPTPADLAEHAERLADKLRHNGAQ